jgi:hypothetical protein
MRSLTRTVRADSGTLSLIFSALVVLAEVEPDLSPIVASIRGTRANRDRPVVGEDD